MSENKQTDSQSLGLAGTERTLRKINEHFPPETPIAKIAAEGYASKDPELTHSVLRKKHEVGLK